MSTRVAFLAVVAAVAAMLVGLFIAGLEGDPGITDTPVYQTYGGLIEDGRVPYRDFGVEYPPGALVPFVLPALVSSTPTGYDTAFQALMIFSLAGASALIVLSLAALRTSTARIALSLGCLLRGAGPARAVPADAVRPLRRHRDPRPPSVRSSIAAGTSGPCCSGSRSRRRSTPPCSCRCSSRGQRAREAPCGAAGDRALRSAPRSLVYLPFAVLAPEGVVRSVWRQLGRPLQIESLGSGVLLALHHAARDAARLGVRLRLAEPDGHGRLGGRVADDARRHCRAPLRLGALRDGATREDDARFVRYAAAATVAFVAFGKVLSPQFLVWLLAVVVLVPGRRGVGAMALLVVACALTRLWFPRTYWELVKEFDPTSSWLVLVA